MVHTDQSVHHGGDGTAPEALDLFLASLAASAGRQVLAFCAARGISTEGVELVQRHRFDEASRRLTCVDLELVLPASFPEQHRAGIVKAAEGCRVAGVLASPPDFGVTLRVPDVTFASPSEAPP